MTVMEGSFFSEVILPVMLAIVMVGIGLTLTVDDFKAQSRSKKSLGMGVLAQNIVVPLLALLIAWLLNLPAEIAVGIVLVAATPGGATSNLSAYLARGNTPLAIVMTVVTSFVAIITLPLWVSQALDFWSADLVGDAVVRVPLRDVFSLLAFIIFIPILIGVTFKRMKPDLALRMERMVSVFSAGVMLVLIVGLFLDLGDRAGPILVDAGPAALLLATLAVLAGFALGAATRMPRGDTLAMVCEVGIKNITLGILIGLTVLESEEMAVPSAVYGIVMYIPVSVAIYLGRRWTPQATATTAADA
jgi:bile acid:Na+ symporter, BASS family